MGPTVLCESPAEVLFREICKYFRSTYFVDHFETAASENEIIKSNSTVKNLLKICFFGTEGLAFWEHLIFIAFVYNIKQMDIVII